MKIVIDTNVIASAMFFGGRPEKLVDLLLGGRFDAYTNENIIKEYYETAEKLQAAYPDKVIRFALPNIISKMKQVAPVAKVHVCRDPDDDKDLLAVEKYKDVEIVTVADFLRETFPELY